MREVTRFTNPTYEQQVAFSALNVALGMLAAEYGLNEDDFNEAAGRAVEQAIVDQTAKDIRGRIGEDEA